MSRYVDNIEFVTELCCACGIPFAMTADFMRRRRNDHKEFYCPNGHRQWYSGKTEAQKLREELERKQRALEAEAGRAMALERQRDKVSRSYAKMRERVKNGVCPCCNRTFQNLMQHMKTQHPEYGERQMLRVMRDTYGLTQQAVADEIGVSPAYVSLYERERPVPAYAVIKISEWVAGNAS